MTSNSGSPERPLRIAIVGAGPSGFYAADALANAARPVRVDLYERWPTPFGLVRYGVAPDHAKIKRVTRLYQRTLDLPNVRFVGNVEVGAEDGLSVDTLRELYDAVMITIGSAADRSLGIPGEELLGSWSATEFVGWYNGDPGYQDRDFALDRVKTAVVVGVGNVAVDVARILARRADELASTDIISPAVDALRASTVCTVQVLGRRGGAQAKFSPGELRELIEAGGLIVTADPDGVEPDPISDAWLEREGDKANAKNLELLRALPTERPGDPNGCRVRLRFLTSPVEILGDDQGRVRGVVVEKNRLVDGKWGPAPEGTGARETIACEAVFRSVGYRGVALAGVPFDERSGRIPNTLGRVLDAPGGAPVPGLYTAGWIKRGPTGLIGTNKADAIETVDALLADFDGCAAGDIVDWEGRIAAAWAGIPELFDAERWAELDAHEQASGERQGKPREKVTSVADMVVATRQTTD